LDHRPYRCEGSINYNCGFGKEAAGEATGVALPGGKTPAPESGAGEDDGEPAGAAGVAEVAGEAAPAGAVCCFISSRRNVLSPLALRA